LKATFTKFFEFSSSYAKDGKVWGRNFRLGLTAHPMDEKTEAAFVRAVEEALIKKIHSRDLGLHVDFLKGTDITDLNLLRAFRMVLKEAIVPVMLKSLTLERDANTVTVLSVDENV
jgi:hypothetical protein